MSLLSALGGMIGLAVGGPMGAALGSGIGSLAGGGDIKDALTSGLLGFGIGSIPGAQGFAQSAMGAAGLQGAAGGGGPLAGLFGGAGGAGAEGVRQVAQQGAMQQGAQGGLGTFLGGLAQSPLVMASLMEATQPRGSMMTPLQQQQVATGERVPGYRGTAAPDFRYGGEFPVASRPPVQRAMGGMIEGPGTGTSDSIPAMIYQNGGPVQEAMLSDGEFVMTADAVRGAGRGDRAKGAAKMYEMMNRLERRV
jgi:hypothetical protein